MWKLVVPESGFFTPLERAQVGAMFKVLVPADRHRGIPGANDALAIQFLDNLLAMGSDVYVEIPEWRELYRETLPKLEETAFKVYARALVELSDRQMVEFLQYMQAGLLPSLDVVLQKQLFTALHRHCLQGCFADPRWGGNRDRIMWRWLGYLQPPEEFS